MKEEQLKSIMHKIDLIVESIQRNIEYLLYELNAKKKDKHLLELQNLENEMLRMKELIIIVFQFKDVISLDEKKHEITKRIYNGNYANQNEIVDMLNPELVKNIRKKLDLDE